MTHFRHNNYKTHSKGGKKRKSRRGDHIVESKAETLTIDVQMLEQKLEREKPLSSDN